MKRNEFLGFATPSAPDESAARRQADLIRMDTPPGIRVLHGSDAASKAVAERLQGHATHVGERLSLSPDETSGDDSFALSNEERRRMLIGVAKEAATRPEPTIVISNVANLALLDTVIRGGTDAEAAELANDSGFQSARYNVITMPEAPDTTTEALDAPTVPQSAGSLAVENVIIIDEAAMGVEATDPSHGMA